MKKVLLILLLVPFLANAQRIVKDKVDKNDGKRYIQTSASTRLDKKKGSTLSGVTFIQYVDGVSYMAFQMNALNAYKIEVGYELTITFTDGDQVTLKSLAALKAVKSGPTYTCYPAYELDDVSFEKIANKEIERISAQTYSLKFDNLINAEYVLNKSASDSVNKIFRFFESYMEKQA